MFISFPYIFSSKNTQKLYYMYFQDKTALLAKIDIYLN